MFGFLVDVSPFLNADLSSRSKSSTHIGHNQIPTHQMRKPGRLSLTMSKPPRPLTLTLSRVFYGSLHPHKSSPPISWRLPVTTYAYGPCPVLNPCRAPTPSPGLPVNEMHPLLSSRHWHFCPTQNPLNIQPL